jgi:hypothetical protein
VAGEVLVDEPAVGGQVFEDKAAAEQQGVLDGFLGVTMEPFDSQVVCRAAASSSGSAGSIALTDSVAVCGSGQQLIANPSDAELIVGAGSRANTVFLSQ